MSDQEISSVRGGLSPRTLLVCGDREWNNRYTMLGALLAFDTMLGPFDTLVHGAARGADEMSEPCMKIIRPDIDVRRYAAEWTKYGKAAGAIRNRKQFDTELPGYVVGFHMDLESSRGTKDMLEYAASKGAVVYLFDGNKFLIWLEDNSG